MWHLVQQQPGETIALGCYEDYDRAKFVLMNTQRFDSKNFYEIMHSSDLVESNQYTFYLTLTMTNINVNNSSAIRLLNVDELEQTAEVQFKNGSKYTYFDVAKDAIRNLLYKSTPDTSLGQWVNNNLLSAGCRYQFGFEG